MLADPYRGETQEVYWIVGIGWALRHATPVRPGAHPGGAWVPALCEVWMRVPFATLWPRRPPSAAVDERCPQCTEAVAERGFASRNWDF
ncbi:hypothetical protein BJ970_002658 [Saccharopolyspora phatthalungensis]|uniref:Uncharacterized protein n=1 Tax=Saccharopolyspora phatthalungensis TaxID=664693 RepID=A0A840Q3M3_9PSEU|nr:hypothetical protein [Saccharopolyspora phatthalungensis]